MVRMRTRSGGKEWIKDRDNKYDYQVFEFIVRIEQYSNNEFEFMTKHFPFRYMCPYLLLLIIPHVIHSLLLPPPTYHHHQPPFGDTNIYLICSS